MKKTLLFLAILFSVSLVAQQNSPDGIQTNKTNQLSSSFAKSQTPIWSEDFANGFPAGWSTYTNNAAGGLATCPWKHSYVGSWGYWNSNQGASAAAAMNSTTAANGFLISDPDSANHWNYGQPSGTTYEYMESYFTTDAIDLSGYANVSLEFQQTYRFNNSINLKVSISTDSMMWTDYNVQGNVNNNTQSPDPQFVSLNISSVAGNSSTVYIKIGWEARVYYWMIDDMQIVETPANKLEIIESNYGGWFTTPLANGFGLDYTFYPINQAIAQPYKVEGVIANLGSQDQITRLNIEVKDDIGTTVYSATSSDSVLSSLDTTTFVGSPLFTPTTVGIYDFTVWGSSDSTITDTINLQSVVTDDLYGRDDGSQYSSYGLGRSCGGMVIGTYYDVFAADQISSISVYIDDESVAGANIFVALYDIDSNNDKIFLDQSNDYTLQASDIDNWVTINFSFPINVIPGSYMAAVGGYPHPIDTSLIGMSVLARPTTCYIQKNGCLNTGQTFGSWYWTSRVPMIRVNMSSLTAIEKPNDFDVLEIYPNPATETLMVSSIGESGIYTIELIDFLGKSLYFDKLHLESHVHHKLDISFLPKGVYMLKMSNDQNSVSKKFIKE